MGPEKASEDGPNGWERINSAIQLIRDQVDILRQTAEVLERAKALQQVHMERSKQNAQLVQMARTHLESANRSLLRATDLLLGTATALPMDPEVQRAIDRATEIG